MALLARNLRNSLRLVPKRARIIQRTKLTLYNSELLPSLVWHATIGTTSSMENILGPPCTGERAY